MLTSRQEEILDFIRGYQRTHGIPPSSRIIKRQFNFASHTSALKHLRALAGKGAVVQLADGSWGVKAREVQGLIDLPLLGAIPAGTPDEREQEGTESVAVDPAIFGVPTARLSNLWALRVSGDSMVGAFICDGDIGVFERREPRPGEIVAALVDETTTTLKRLIQTSEGMVLRAENPRYADIVPQEKLECQGVLVGVIRRVATAG
jgi:SOS regulatory protein LexA